MSVKPLTFVCFRDKKAEYAAIFALSYALSGPRGVARLDSVLTVSGFTQPSAKEASQPRSDGGGERPTNDNRFRGRGRHRNYTDAQPPVLSQLGRHYDA